MVAIASERCKERREDIDEAVRGRRHDIFFEKKFHAIGERLQQSVRADVERPDARLNARNDLALEPGEVGQRRHQYKNEDDDLD